MLVKSFFSVIILRHCKGNRAACVRGKVYFAVQLPVKIAGARGRVRCSSMNVNERRAAMSSGNVGR